LALEGRVERNLIFFFATNKTRLFDKPSNKNKLVSLIEMFRQFVKSNKVKQRARVKRE